MCQIAGNNGILCHLVMNEFMLPPVYESLRIVANEEFDCVGVTSFVAQKTHNLKYL